MQKRLLLIAACWLAVGCALRANGQAAPKPTHAAQTRVRMCASVEHIRRARRAIAP